jgi:hypothetical protein
LRAKYRPTYEWEPLERQHSRGKAALKPLALSEVECAAQNGEIKDAGLNS